MRTIGQNDDGREVTLVDELIAAMKKVFGDDEKRVGHALFVLNQAKEIIKEEEADPEVVLAAAILHDIGIHEAERKHGSSAGIYQEMEGPAIAKPIMEEISLDKESIKHVLKIIANHHSAKDIDTPGFRILWDADWIVNTPDLWPKADKGLLTEKIEKIFKTEAGKKKAYQLFVEMPHS